MSMPGFQDLVHDDTVSFLHHPPPATASYRSLETPQLNLDRIYDYELPPTPLYYQPPSPFFLIPDECEEEEDHRPSTISLPVPEPTVSSDDKLFKKPLPVAPKPAAAGESPTESFTEKKNADKSTAVKPAAINPEIAAETMKKNAEKHTVKPAAINSEIAAKTIKIDALNGDPPPKPNTAVDKILEKPVTTGHFEKRLTGKPAAVIMWRRTETTEIPAKMRPTGKPAAAIMRKMTERREEKKKTNAEGTVLLKVLEERRKTIEREMWKLSAKKHREEKAKKKKFANNNENHRRKRPSFLKNYKIPKRVWLYDEDVLILNPDAEEYLEVYGEDYFK